MSAFDELRALLKVKDFEGALARVREIEDRIGPSARLAVVEAQCLQLSEEASLEQVESTLNRALSLDDECVDAYLELGWFRLAVLDNPNEARSAFVRAAKLLKRFNQEVVDGLLACDAELTPGASIEAARSQYENTLLHDEKR